MPAATASRTPAATARAKAPSGSGTPETPVEDTNSVLGLREAGVIRPLEDVYKAAEEQLDAGYSMPSWSAM